MGQGGRDWWEAGGRPRGRRQEACKRQEAGHPGREPGGRLVARCMPLMIVSGQPLLNACMCRDSGIRLVC